jgi:1-deoxy-D-xylulose-5-phosphate synthase
VGSALLEFFNAAKIHDIVLTTFEYKDDFIGHGSTHLVEESLGILPKQLAKRVEESIKG